VRTSELDYALPADLIAQQPAEPRSSARLLVYDRATREIRHRTFADLPDELQPEDLVVVNNTRVLAARIHARRATGGAVELLLLERNGDGSWDAMSPEAQAGDARHVPKLCLEYRAMSRERVPLQAYRRFNFPVLLLQGERSLQPAHLIVRQLHRAMKSATLHTVYGAAHMGPLTHPAAVNALMVDHISRAEQADPTVEQFLPIEKRLAEAARTSLFFQDFAQFYATQSCAAA